MVSKKEQKKEEKKNSKKGFGKGKQIAIYFVLVAIVFVTSGVVAETVGLSDSAQKVIEDILSNKGIDPDDVESMEQVTFDNLPEQIDIENIDDTNLAVYEIKPLEGNSFYVITASDENFEKQKSVSGEMRYIMDFGYSGAMTGDGFLRTAVGVKTSPEKGYVMMRKGSITGLSTNLESVEGSGVIYITLYKNGEEIGFRNSFVVESSDVSGKPGKVMKDYDIQSSGIITYEQGDVISMYVESEGNVIWKDVITRVEITEN
jgi:hypothetical protein